MFVDDAGFLEVAEDVEFCGLLHHALMAAAIFDGVDYETANWFKIIGIQFKQRFAEKLLFGFYHKNSA